MSSWFPIIHGWKFWRFSFSAPIDGLHLKNVASPKPNSPHDILCLQVLGIIGYEFIIETLHVSISQDVFVSPIFFQIHTCVLTHYFLSGAFGTNEYSLFFNHPWALTRVYFWHQLWYLYYNILWLCNYCTTNMPPNWGLAIIPWALEVCMKVLQGPLMW